MRNQKYRNPIVPAGILQQLQNLFSGVIVKRSRRLIAEQEFRILGDRTRDRHPLLFSSGKLRRKVIFAVRQSHFCEHLPGIERISAHLRRKFHILYRCEIRHQIVELEYKPDIGTPVSDELLFVILCNISAIHLDLARSRHIHSA